jgi:L,D-peptidoglycan transpeptidase YkuD (ErfK/YbiS/YcfS/YnhG family)
VILSALHTVRKKKNLRYTRAREQLIQKQHVWMFFLEFDWNDTAQRAGDGEQVSSLQFWLSRRKQAAAGRVRGSSDCRN